MPKDAENIDVSAYFVLVGLIFGAALGAVMLLVSRLFYGLSFPAAALLIALMALATRLRYWKALAAVADGWFADRQRRLEVMSEGPIAAFGVAAIVFVALIEVGSLQMYATATTAGLVVLAPVFARLAAFFSAALGTPAGVNERGAQAMRRPGWIVIVTVFVTLVAAFALSLVMGVDPMLLGASAVLGLVVALVVPHLVSERFGGVTGETAGASVLLTEMLVLLGTLAVAGGMRLLGWIA